MSNILQFALGLNLGNFLSNATKAVGGTAALLGATVSVGAAISKLGQQIERGARLEDLANRTGVAVGALNGLQRGFGAVGVEGDAFLGVIAPGKSFFLRSSTLRPMPAKISFVGSPISLKPPSDLCRPAMTPRNASPSTPTAPKPLCNKLSAGRALRI